MSLPSYLFFDSLYSLLCYENPHNTQQFSTINFSTESKCESHELDEHCSFTGEQWIYYLYQFDPECDYCLRSKQQFNLQQITSSKSNVDNNGDHTEFQCKVYELIIYAV